MTSRPKPCSRSIDRGRSESTDAGRRRRPDAFTLLEVLVAVTIFSIISLAIYSTFRVGMKSYAAGREQMEIVQTARVVFDLLTRDLRSLHYLPESQYNRNLIAQLQMRHVQQMQSSQMPGVRQLARGLRGQGRPRGNGEEEEEEPLRGIPIDLSIVGTNGEDLDSLTFVTYQVNWGTATVGPWAMVRVKYFVEDGQLMRAEGPIWVDEVPRSQWRPTLPLPGLIPGAQGDPSEEPDEGPASVEDFLPDARAELIARNIRMFDVEYGYWTEDGWFQAAEWDSGQRRFRSPPPDIDPFDPLAQQLHMRHQTLPTDNVPAYITVTIGLAPEEEGKTVRIFRTRIRLPASSESFLTQDAMIGGYTPLGPGPGAGQLTPFGGGAPGVRP